jgi:hypothetical protein
MKILMTILALLYTFWPIDFIPDWLIGAGWLDDLTLLAALWYFYFYKKGPYFTNRSYSRSNTHRQTHQNNQGRFQGEKENGDQPSDGNNPYKILGIEPTADKEQIKQAYRHLANQYHPDKVAHLGKEFQVLAEKRFKEIQQAYQQLMGSHS